MKGCENYIFLFREMQEIKNPETLQIYYNLKQ